MFKGLINFLRKYRKISLILITASIIPPIVLNFTVFEYSTEKANGKLSDWFTFFGGYSGGIIGGIVAFIVARYQIDKQSENEHIKMLASELPVYIAIGLELEKILLQLDSYIKLQEEHKKKYNDEEIKLNLYYKSIPMDALIWDRWDHLWKISDPVLLGEMLKFNESFKRTIEVLEFDIEAFELEYNNKKMISNTEYGLSRDQLYLEAIKRDKVHYWKEIVYCKEKANLINNKIITKQQDILNLINKGQSIFLKYNVTKLEELKVDRGK